MALDPPRWSEDPDADDELLPCGASLAEIWDAGQPSAGHGDCPHCRGAVAEMDALHDLVAEAVVPDLGGAGSAGEQARHADFSARVMDVVRTELRPGPLVPLTDPEDEHSQTPDADDWIAEAAATRVLRAAAEREQGVSAGSCRIRPLAAAPDRPVLVSQLPREPLRVRIEIAVDPVADLPDTAERVRRRVADAADREVGLAVAAIDVAVVELRGEPSPAPTRRTRRTPR